MVVQSVIIASRIKRIGHALRSGYATAPRRVKLRSNVSKSRKVYMNEVKVMRSGDYTMQIEEADKTCKVSVSSRNGPAYVRIGGSYETVMAELSDISNGLRAFFG
jgi:hypothetical protein